MQQKCNSGFRCLLGALIMLGFPFVLAVSIASADDGPSIGYTLTPFYPAKTDGARLSKVKINGSNIVPAIEAGSKFTVDVTFDIVNGEGCPTCIAQITVGFSHDVPTRCIYSDIPTTIQTGTRSFTLRAPGVPGRFYLAFDRPLQFSCADALAVQDWSTGSSPSPAQYFAVIDVY